MRKWQAIGRSHKRMMFVMWLLVYMVFNLANISFAAGSTKVFYDSATLPNGDLGVLYTQDGTLCYGVFNPSTTHWSYSEIASAKDAALAIDSSGEAHVVYVTTGDDIKYVVENGSSWTNMETFDSIAFGGVDGALTSPDIEVDASGTAHIIYLDAKGGYAGGNDYSSYDKEDLIYCENSSGSFSRTIQSYSHGWFYSPDGWRNLNYAPVKMTLVSGDYVIGAKQYQYDKSMTTQYHTYDFNFYADAGAQSVVYRSSTTNSDLGSKVYDMASDGSTYYTLVYKSGDIYVMNGLSDLGGTAFTSAVTGADLTVSDSGALYYASILTDQLNLYEDGVFYSGITLPMAMSTTYTKVGTNVDDQNQYVIYTDSTGIMWICSSSLDTGNLNPFEVPDKLPVTIEGLSISDKTYDGEAVVVLGTLQVTGAELTEADLTFSFTSTDGGSYDSQSPPTDAGDYKLVISVPDANALYYGSSDDIAFSITPIQLTPSGYSAIDRDYISGDVSVSLDLSAFDISGVLEADAADVAIDLTAVTGGMSDDSAGVGKSVSMGGFVLSGARSQNYVLDEPVMTTVTIARQQLLTPVVTLGTNMVSGGLTALVTDAVNTAGLSDYTVVIYQNGLSVKVLSGVQKNVSESIAPTGVIAPEGLYTAAVKAVADASGNYSDSALSAQTIEAIAAYAPLVLNDDPSFDLSGLKVSEAIAAIDFSSAMVGGKPSYHFASADLPSWLNLSEDGVLTGTPNAVLGSTTATISVTDGLSDSAQIEIAIGAVAKGSPIAFGGTPVSTRMVYGDSAQVMDLSYEGDSSNVAISLVSGPGILTGNSLEVTGAGTIRLSMTGTSPNYEDQVATVDIEVASKLVTLTPTLQNFTKAFGSTDPSFDYTSSALVGSDSLVGALLVRDSGEDVGTYSVEIASNAEVLNPNYTFALSAPTTLEITPKVMTFSIDSISAEAYTGSQLTPSVIVRDGSDGLVLNQDYQVAYGANISAGVQAGTVTITGEGNYLGSAGTAAFDIEQALYAGALSLSTQVIKDHEQTGIALTLDALSLPSGFVNAEITNAAYDDNASGLLTGYQLVDASNITYDVAAMATGTTASMALTIASDNYIDITYTVDIETVDKTPVTLSGLSLADKVYDGIVVHPTGTLQTDVVYAGSFYYLYEGEGATVYSSIAAPKNVGTYVMTVSIPDSSERFTGSLSLHFEITKATLTVKPQDTSVYLNASLPTFSVSYIGLKGNDVGTDIVRLESGDLTITAYEQDNVTPLLALNTAGQFALKLSGMPVFEIAENYEIITADGQLTVNRRPSTGGGGGTTTSAVTPTTPVPTPTVPTPVAPVQPVPQTPVPQVPTVVSTVGVTATLQNNRAVAALTQNAVAEMMNQAISSGGTSQNGRLDFAIAVSPTASAVSVQMAQGDLARITAETDADVAFTSNMISIAFDNTALETIANASTAGVIDISAERVNQAELPIETQAVVQNRPVIRLSSTNNGLPVSDFRGGQATIAFPYTLQSGENPEAIVVYHLSDDGALDALRGYYDAQSATVIFQTPHFSNFVIGFNPVSYEDVADDAWYHCAVSYVSAQGIASGTGEDCFSPSAMVTRGQFMMMLLNAYQIRTDGLTADALEANFSDAGQTYYTEALAMAKQLGIVEGIGQNQFNPEGMLTRQEMMVMLSHTLSILDEVPMMQSDLSLDVFSDLEDLAMWATSDAEMLCCSGVMSGFDGKLCPTQCATRAEVAQIIYNLLVEY